MSKIILDGELRMRANNKSLQTFETKSLSVTGKPYQMFIREIIDAFNEGRLRIIATEEQKTQLGELYNVD